MGAVNACVLEGLLPCFFFLVSCSSLASSRSGTCTCACCCLQHHTQMLKCWEMSASRVFSGIFIFHLSVFVSLSQLNRVSLSITVGTATNPWRRLFGLTRRLGSWPAERLTNSQLRQSVPVTAFASEPPSILVLNSAKQTRDLIYGLDW